MERANGPAQAGATLRALFPSPDRTPLAIGAKLRGTRLAQGLTLADLAVATGLNRGFLSKVERDETSPSVSSLVAICQTLSLPIGSLFEDPQVEVVSLADATRINMGGSDVRDLLVTPRHESRVQVLRSRLGSHASGGNELYTVNCDVEIVHVISGRVTIHIPNASHTLGAGDTMTLPGREPHTWENAHDGETDLVWVLVPAAWSGSSPSRT